MANGAARPADPGIEAWMARPGDGTQLVRPPPVRPPLPLPPIDVVVRGDVPHGDIPYAHNQVVATMAGLDAPVLHARLKLTLLADPTVARPVVAEAVLDVAGDLVRAHVAAPSTPEAADRLALRLLDRLDVRRRRGPGGPAEHRPSYCELPLADREVVRRKVVAPAVTALDGAILEMECLDYDFRLFVDAATGVDTVVSRTEYGAYRVSSAAAAPVLRARAALDRLGTGHERFVLFAEAVTRRGNVAYRRFDGHYGLLSPR